MTQRVHRNLAEIPQIAAFARTSPLPRRAVVYSFSKRGVASFAFDASNGIPLKKCTNYGAGRGAQELRIDSTNAIRVP